MRIASAQWSHRADRVSAPSAIYNGSTVIVFGEGADHKLWWTLRRAGGGYANWTLLGSALTAQPGALFTGGTAFPSRYEVFVCGTDGAVYRLVHGATGWASAFTVSAAGCWTAPGPQPPMPRWPRQIFAADGRAPVAQRGKAKQKRSDLRLVGLGLVVTRDGGIPLTWHAYPGSKPDVTQFPAMIDQLRGRYQAVCDTAGVPAAEADMTVVFEPGRTARPTSRTWPAAGCTT